MDYGTWLKLYLSAKRIKEQNDLMYDLITEIVRNIVITNYFIDYRISDKQNKCTLNQAIGYSNTVITVLENKNDIIEMGFNDDTPLFAVVLRISAVMFDCNGKI